MISGHTGRRRIVIVSMIASLVGMALGAFALTVVYAQWGIDWDWLSVAFMVPYPGILVGVVTSLFVALGKRLFRERKHKFDWRIIALVSILSVFVMIYGQYRALYVVTNDGRVSLVHSLTAPANSVPLSSKVAFSHHLSKLISHDSFNFRLRGRVISNGFNVTGTWAVIMFCLKFVGIIITPLVTYDSLTKSWRYSDTHRRYYRRKRLVRDLPDFENVLAFLEHHNVTLGDTFLESSLAAGPRKDASKWLVELHWCKQSDPGEIVVRGFIVEGQRYVEDETRRCALPVDNAAVSSLLAESNS